MKRRSLWLALLASISLAFALTTSVSATSVPGDGSITIRPEKGKFECGKWYTVKAIVKDNKGHPIKGVTVRWSFVLPGLVSAKDKIDPKTSKTDKHGVAKTRVKLSCKSLADRVIRATAATAAGPLSATAVIRVKKHHDDDDDHDGDHDGDHDRDGDDDDHRGHHNDVTISSVARTDSTSTRSSVSLTGTSASSGVYGAVLAFTADSLPSTATSPANASNDGLPISPAIPALLAVLTGLAIILRRFQLSRR